jgi:hypothetical protein
MQLRYTAPLFKEKKSSSIRDIYALNRFDSVTNEKEHERRQKQKISIWAKIFRHVGTGGLGWGCTPPVVLDVVVD